MSQSTDLALGNQTGSAFRAELNSVLAAIGSNHKGNTTPTYALAGMQWIDESGTPWEVYYYDGTDNIMLGKIDPATDKFWLSGQADATELSGVPTVKQIQNGSVKHATTAGSSNAYTLDLGAGLRPAAYVEGMELNVEFSFGNTGAATINVTGSGGTGLGAKSIKLPGGTDPTEGELPNGGQATLRYDGTDFILMGGFVPGAAFGTQTSLASASTTSLGTIASRNVLITGTANITSFGSAASTARPFYMIKFSGVLTLTHNGTSLIIPGAADITTAANDSALVEYLGSGNWRIRDYMKADGTGIISGSEAGWVPIKTVTASNVSSVDFANGSGDVVFDGTYKAYFVVISNMIPANDDSNFGMRTSANTGSSFDSGGSDYTSAAQYQQGSSTVSGAFQTTAQIELNLGFGSGNQSGEGSNWIIKIFDPANSARQTVIKWEHVAASPASASLGYQQGAAKRNSAAVVDAIRFFMGSGNITSGTFTLYGIKDAP